MTFSPTRPLHRFQSTPSARRATAGGAFQDPGRVQISIHALREEGDRQRCCKVQRFLHFNPRPPRGGRHFELVHPQSQSKFQSTPSARRATFSRSYRSTYSQFQSTPSARRATVFIGIHRTGHGISIHALREEGDSPPDDVEMLPEISIHALREEGDATVHFRC